MRHESAIKDLEAADRACWDAKKHYEEVTVKHFPAGCVVRWSQSRDFKEYHFTGEVIGISRPGVLLVRNLKTGKRRDNIYVLINKVIRLDGVS